MHNSHLYRRDSIYRFCKLILLFLIVFEYSKGQDAIYIKSPTVHKIIGTDTVFSFIEGKVIDSLSRQPIKNVDIHLFTSIGDAILDKTDSLGYFKINTLPTDCEIKLMCFFSDSIYAKKLWHFSTIGLSDPIQLKVFLEVNKK